MGAWGHKSFENDDALDWANDLDRRGIPAITDAFSEIPEDTSVYVEAPQACAAIGAAEIVAALKGKPSASLPTGVVKWLRGKPQPSPQLIALARTVLDRILAASELKELWEEGEEPIEWQTEMGNLRSRLDSI